MLGGFTSAEGYEGQTTRLSLSRHNAGHSQAVCIPKTKGENGNCIFGLGKSPFNPKLRVGAVHHPQYLQLVACIMENKSDMMK